MQACRRNTAIAILVIFAILIAIPTILQFSVIVAKHTAREKLERQQTVTIRVGVDQLHWIDYGKELKIDDRMFDVKNYRVEGNGYLLTGNFDDLESALSEKIDEFWNSKENPAIPLIGKYFQGVSMLLFPCVDIPESGTFELTSQFNNRYTLTYLSAILTVSTPPPQDS